MVHKTTKARKRTNVQKKPAWTNDPEVIALQKEVLKKISARFDASQTTRNNENHWSNADHFDPHMAVRYDVRRTLRSRSRYELIENNPYLKGCIVTIANDFVGAGPKLQIIDKRLSEKTNQIIEARWQEWCQAIQLRKKLWRLVMAKMVDGEGLGYVYNSIRRKLEFRQLPISLDLYLFETDRLTNPIADDPQPADRRIVEEDGLRWNKYEEPVSYHVLNRNPTQYTFLPEDTEGKWIDADNVIHWFRKDRGWLRGIPELTPSLPLCALLRRYTLAVVRAAEFAASFTGVLETEGPPSQMLYQQGQTDENMFDTIPIQHAMFTVLPWGTKLHQLEGTQPMAVYDEFVVSLLREIVRPLCIPFNLAAGTSKDANMSSAILDTHIYKENQHQLRFDANDDIMNPLFVLWFKEAVLVDGYLPHEARDLYLYSTLNRYATARSYVPYPARAWRWDKIGMEHTDPEKIVRAMSEAHDKGFLTDRDIQEGYYNRRVEDWQKDYQETIDFREKNGNIGLAPPGGYAPGFGADPAANSPSMGDVKKPKAGKKPAGGKKPSKAKATAKANRLPRTPVDNLRD